MPWRPTLVVADDGSRVDPVIGAREMLNVTPTPEGYTAVRGGFRAYETTDLYGARITRIAGLYVGRFEGQDRKEFVVQVYDRTDSEGLEHQHIVIRGQNYFRTATNSKIEGSAGKIPSFQSIGDRLYISRPGDRPVSWNRLHIPGFAVEKTVPACHYLGYYASRLFCGRLNENHAMIRWSAPFQHGDFEDLGSGFDVASDKGGQLVRGISPEFYGDLYVFTTDTFSRINFRRPSSNPLLTYQRQTISNTIGGFHHTIAQWGNDLIWTSKSGVHSLLTTQRFGDVEQEFLSVPIRRIFEEASAKDFERCWATVHPKKDLYLLALPMTETLRTSLSGSRVSSFDPGELRNASNVILCCHLPTRRWSIWDFPAESIAVMDELWGPLLGPEILVGGGIDSRRVGLLDTPDHFDVFDYSWGTADFEAVTYNARIGTHPIDCGDNSVRKNFKKADLYFRSGSTAFGTLHWMIDDDWQEGGDTERILRSDQFFLNPNGELVIGDVAGGNGTVFSSSLYFGGAGGRQLERYTIPLAGSGNAIRFVFEVESRRFDLYGFDLWYVPESNQGFQSKSTVTEAEFVEAGPPGSKPPGDLDPEGFG